MFLQFFIMENSWNTNFMGWNRLVNLTPVSPQQAQKAHDDKNHDHRCKQHHNCRPDVGAKHVGAKVTGGQIVEINGDQCFIDSTWF